MSPFHPITCLKNCPEKSWEPGKKIKLKINNANGDPWDMLNNFCFHVFAQKSLFVSENGKGFFWTSSSSSPAPMTFEFIELDPS